jgi:hypothetical protein
VNRRDLFRTVVCSRSRGRAGEAACRGMAAGVEPSGIAVGERLGREESAGPGAVCTGLGQRLVVLLKRGLGEQNMGLGSGGCLVKA